MMEINKFMEEILPISKSFNDSLKEVRAKYGLSKRDISILPMPKDMEGDVGFSVDIEAIRNIPDLPRVVEGL